jgi:hypothetical protein
MAATKKAKPRRAAKITPSTPPTKTTFMLRTCAADMSSYYGSFIYPTSGMVECPDWSPRKACGNGLHGLLHGKGDYSLMNDAADAKWLILAVNADDVVEIDSAKCKVPRGEVVFVGTGSEAVAKLLELDPEADRASLPYAQASASGDYGQASASGSRGQASASGDYGQASASGYQGQASASGYQGQASASGDYGQASASGDYGQASASGYQGQASASGDYGQASASGDYGQASASGYQGQASASGDYGQASASGYQGQASASGYQGQASASGDYGQASASGYQGQASASGDYGQASASGYQGQASASGSRGQASASGSRGQASAGRGGRSRSGQLGILILFRWDDAAQRERVVVAYVGENGIKENTWYRLNDAGEIVEASDAWWDEFNSNVSAEAKALACPLEPRA